MKKFYWLLYSILLALVMTLPVAADQITYDFEDVKVDFAASFDATPVSVHVYDWFADKSGGPDKPINILYGIVDLKSSNGIWKEEFIKVTGENGSERFLSNSMSTEWYDPGSYTKLRTIKTVFWSGKQLTDKTVVKDYSQPLKVITLRKDFDESQKLTSMAVEFTRQDKAGYSNDASYSCYTADMSTLITFGNPLKE